jgi:hypothetical protein
MGLKRILLITVILAVFSLSGLVSAQGVDTGGINASDLVGELSDTPETDVYQTLDSDTYIKDVTWDGENNTAYLTIVSSNSEQLTIYDYNVYQNQGTAPFQKFTIQGEETIQVDATSQGIQRLSVSTENRINLVKSGTDLNLTKKVVWFFAFAILLFAILVMTIYRKKEFDRKRLSGVFDLVSGEIIETVFESDKVDTSSWSGKIKYAYLNSKESFYENVVYNKLALSLSPAVILVFDFLLLNGEIYYTITGNRYGRLAILLLIPALIIGYMTGGKMLDWFYNPREVIVFVLDEGEIEVEDMEEMEDLADVIENYGKVSDGGIRILEMAEEVYSRFETAIEDDLHEKPYKGDIEQNVKIARRADLENARFLPNWEKLKTSDEVQQYHHYAKENNNLLRKFADKIDRLIGASAGIEEIAMRKAYRQVAEDMQDALSGDEEVTIDEFVSQIMEQGEEEEEVEALEELADAMTPSSEKKEIESNGGENE